MSGGIEAEVVLTNKRLSMYILLTDMPNLGRKRERESTTGGQNGLQENSNKIKKKEKKGEKQY